MKKLSILFIAVILIITAGNVFGQKKEAVQKNKEVATKYHDLKADDIDAILTKDFMGRNEKSQHRWNIEDHRFYVANNAYKKDSICQQVAEGDWVATRFVRTMDYQGKRIQIEAMQFKRFENGKIAEIWEFGDSKQVEIAEK
jgi:predicted SnoaL-like aldol condensation-catalyzing enzyme